MAAVATVEDGKIVQADNTAKKPKSVNDGMDKDSFLQLLVAQMQYQDPLEPTSNTEYISQYAQFSQVQQIQNMASSLELQRANTLIGQEVYIETSTTQGPKTIQGKVDYVAYDTNGDIYVSVGGELYPFEDVNTVADKEYQEAFMKAYDFVIALNKLPSVHGIDLSDGEAIDELEKIYNEMTDYQKSFLAKEKVDILNKYIEKLKEVRLTAGEGDGDGNVTDPDKDNTDNDGTTPPDPDAGGTDNGTTE